MKTFKLLRNSNCYLSQPLGTTELQIRLVESLDVQKSYVASIIPGTDSLLCSDKDRFAILSWRKDFCLRFFYMWENNNNHKNIIVSQKLVYNTSLYKSMFFVITWVILLFGTTESRGYCQNGGVKLGSPRSLD